MRVTFSHDVDRRSGKKRAKNAVIVGMAAPGMVQSCLQSGKPVDRVDNPHQPLEIDEISKSSTEAESSALTELPAATPANPLACYDRAELLAAFSLLRKAPATSAMNGTGIRTLYMPRAKAKVVPARRASAASDGTSSEHGSLTGDGLELLNEPLSPLSFMTSYPMFAPAHYDGAW